MGAMVEEAMNKAISALTNRIPDLADEVILNDRGIDLIEIEIQETCLKTLALHQPVAADLRFIVTVLKVNNDLERMGDLAVNIAERSRYLSRHDMIPVPLNFQNLMTNVRTMVNNSLKSLINLDTHMARSVCESDDAVDALNREMFVNLQDLMKQDSTTIERGIRTLSVSRYLERIADLATNIAEEVIFMVEGDIVKHHYAETKNKNP